MTIHFEQSITINASAERIWAVLIDMERWPEWTASMSSIKRGEDTPFGVGATAHIKQPRLPAGDWRVTECQPDRWFASETKSPGLEIVAGHRITPGPTGCTVLLSIDQSGFMSGMVGRIYGGRIRRYLDMEANGLKARCESAP